MKDMTQFQNDIIISWDLSDHDFPVIAVTSLEKNEKGAGLIANVLGKSHSTSGTVSLLQLLEEKSRERTLKEFTKMHRELMLAFCDDDDQISLKVCEYDANTYNLIKDIIEGGERDA